MIHRYPPQNQVTGLKEDVIMSLLMALRVMSTPVSSVLWLPRRPSKLVVVGGSSVGYVWKSWRQVIPVVLTVVKICNISLTNEQFATYQF